MQEPCLVFSVQQVICEYVVRISLSPLLKFLQLVVVNKNGSAGEQEVLSDYMDAASTIAQYSSGSMGMKQGWAVVQ